MKHKDERGVQAKAQTDGCKEREEETGREQSAANKELKDVLYLRITVVHSKSCVNCFTVFIF